MCQKTSLSLGGTILNLTLNSPLEIRSVKSRKTGYHCFYLLKYYRH